MHNTDNKFYLINNANTHTFSQKYIQKDAKEFGRFELNAFIWLLSLVIL